MTWNQPPKKEIKPARAKDIEFVKPSHGDINEVKGVQSIQRNQFDPRHPVHRVLNPDKLNQLLKRVQTSMPGTGNFGKQDHPKRLYLERINFRHCGIMSCFGMIMHPQYPARSSLLLLKDSAQSISAT